MVKILYTSEAVRQAIRHLFSQTKRRRVAVVAFVGSGADAYMYNPKGLHLVCWQEPSATDPDMVALLQRRGAKVEFCKRLHMKLYWTEGTGAVITSANLTTNAMGARSLREIGVLLTPNPVDVDRILSSLKRTAVTPQALQRLRERRSQLERRYEASNHETEANTFGDWYRSPRKRPWKIATWSKYGNLPSVVRSTLRKHHGSVDFADTQSVQPKHVRQFDWILSVRTGNNTVGAIGWMHADHVIKVPRGQRYRDAAFPFEVVQVHPASTYSGRPFAIDKRFRDAFRSVADRLGADAVEALNRPSKGLLDAVWRHYRRSGNSKRPHIVS